MRRHNSLDFTLHFGFFPDVAAHRRMLSSASVGQWLDIALIRAAEIAIRVVGEEESRELNRRYRRKDSPTNVLTFDYSRDPMVMADIVLCGPVVQREAAAQSKPLKNHYAHLLVHGVLHAQGYEHETNERHALEMEALEILLLGALGIRNPY
ncbi:MAG TPA: rRNA maturation RNase YbeY [Ramlibacter sp.]|nr:rRNA maturation RNase YbeY [Ramlibacter sp.]